MSEKEKPSIADLAQEALERLMRENSQKEKGQSAKEIFEKEKRIKQEKRDAEEFAKKVKEKGAQHVTTSMKDWGEKNKYPSSLELSFEKQLAQSKKTLEAALSVSKSKPHWLGITSSDQIQHCPQAAEFVARIALLPEELQNDPYILYREAARLAMSLDTSISKEANNEALILIKKTISHVENRIGVMKKEDLAFLFPLTEQEMIHSLSEQGMGGVVSPVPDHVYNEADPSSETVIKDLELIQKLKDINYEIRVDPSVKDDTPRLRQLKRDLIDLGKNKNIDPQIKEASVRLQVFINKAEYEHSGGARREWQSYMSTLGLSMVEAEEIMNPDNPGGYQEVLDDLLSIVESSPGAEWDHAIGSIQYKIAGIQELIAQRFKNNPRFVEGAREWVGMEVGVRRLAHELSRIQTEGKFEDIHKFWGHIGGDDFDHLLRSTPFMSQAISAEDTALRSLMSEISLRWDLLESQVQAKARETINDPNIDKKSERYEDALAALADPSKEKPGDFRKRHAIAKELFANNSEDLLDWQMGKTVRPKDVQISGDRFNLLNKQMAIRYRDLLEKAKSAELSSDEKAMLDDGLYKKAFEQHEITCKSRNEDMSSLRLTHEETDMLSSPSGLTPLDRRAYETLKDSLIMQGLTIDKEMDRTLIKSIINARNFSVITMHRQTVIAHLCELPPGDMSQAEWWISTPYEDTIRFLNKKRWLEDRYRVGGASGEQYRILLSGYEPVVAKYVNGVAEYKRGKRLIDAAIAEKYDTLIELRKRSGIDYEAIAQEDLFKMGGDLDATTWRVRLGLLNKQLLEQYDVDGNRVGVKIDSNQGLAFQIQESGVGTAERQELMRKLFAKDPIVAMHYFPKEMQQLLKNNGVSEAELPKVWSTIQKTLSIFEQKTVYDENYKHKSGFTTNSANASADIASYTEPDLLPKILNTIGVSEAEQNQYIDLIKKIVDHATSDVFVKDMASVPMPFVLTISDVDWSKSEYACLGSAAHNRRQRDQGGKAQADIAELKLADDPSPMNIEDFWKNLKELQTGMQAYLGKENPNTNKRVYRELYAYSEYNRDQLEWIPGLSWLSQFIPASYGETLDMLEIGGKKLFKNRGAFPYASHARSRKGPHAPAINVNARAHFVNEAQRREFLTDLKLYDKLKKDQKATPVIQFFYYFRWAYPILAGLMVSNALKKSLEEEEKRK